MPALLNGKREKAKSTKMVTEEKEKSTAKPVEVEAEENTESKRVTLLKRLEPEMLTDPYPIDYAGVEDSSEFCLEKCYQTILGPLGQALPAEKDWLEFARTVWEWRNQVEERELRTRAKNLYAASHEDPRVWEMMLEFEEQNS